jgi:orotidine-5'-phosphate decarboxylase
MSFLEKLRLRWHQAQTLLCVGLDPELERLPPTEREGRNSEDALVAFTVAIVDATADLACAFKPNVAFYEAHGPQGLQALIRTITYIHEHYPEVPVLLDAKRGDVGNTSAAYARAAFDVCGADAVTIQPYLGRDALEPFLERGDRGCFVLCRTSNPRSGEVQCLPVGAVAEPLYLAIARQVAEEWNTRRNCGLVVGATYPGELRSVRTAVGDLPILVPGIGAQGGALEAAVHAGLDGQQAGLLVSASRSILYASAGRDFAAAARREAVTLRDDIERLRTAA